MLFWCPIELVDVFDAGSTYLYRIVSPAFFKPELYAYVAINSSSALVFQGVPIYWCKFSVRLYTTGGSNLFR